MGKIIVSLGQIPAKLDLVKYIGNKYQGGLTLQLAIELGEIGYDVEIVKWKYNKIDVTNINIVHNVDNIDEYLDFMLAHEYDVYVLGAAVANIMPVTPWKGKFPSHNYNEGDEFDIKFKICPRIINQIKKKYPRSTLIGFKLSTGSYFDAFETLKESNADLIIYNNPTDLHKLTFCYKTFMTKEGNRDEIAHEINYLSEIKYVRTFNTLPHSNNEFDLQIYFQIKELEKYVLDENNHGSIGIVSDSGLYTHTRHNKYVGIVEDNRHIDNNMNIIRPTVGTDKFTEALSMFTWLRNKFPKHKYFIHTHKEGSYISDKEVGYIPPNCGGDSISRILSLSYPFNDNLTQFIIKSECHGYFMSFEKLSDVLNLLTNRNWDRYDPPTRYVNDESDIFNDVLKDKISRNDYQRILEIGGNVGNFPKVCNLVSNIGRLKLDPYFELDSKWKINHVCGDLYDLIIAKNCGPIMGMEMLSNYSKIATRMLFNFPKQYNCNREVECVSGALKKEVSHRIGNKVFHSLVLIKGESPEEDVYHDYDALNKEWLYNQFHKEFDLQFRYTKGGIWCLMERR